jgi:hypothetical protein
VATVPAGSPAITAGTGPPDCRDRRQPWPACPDVLRLLPQHHSQPEGGCNEDPWRARPTIWRALTRPPEDFPDNPKPGRTSDVVLLIAMILVFTVMLGVLTGPITVLARILLDQ